MVSNVSYIQDRNKDSKSAKHQTCLEKLQATGGYDAEVFPHISCLFETIGSDKFHNRLQSLLHEIAEFDEMLIVGFRPDRGATCHFIEASVKTPDAYAAFVQGVYVQSPFYQFARKGGTGFRLLRELASDDFRDSVYFRDCMTPAHLKDEAAYCIQGDKKTSYMVAMGRTDELPLFTNEQVRALRDLTPVVEKALIKHHQIVSTAQSTTTPVETSLQLESNIQYITGDLLTEREREIAGYLIRGYSSKACARELDISPATERVHRKNIYQKLGVNSQAGLLAHVCEKLFSQ